MSRFEEMRTFVRVVEAGGITEAARRMTLAKSAVSRRLSDLEARLKVQLLIRTTRRLTLTDTGRAFYDRCVRLLADLEEAEQAVTSAHADLTGTLRLAAPLSFGLRHLAPALDAFLDRHPALTVDLDLNDRRVNLVEEGVDVAIRIGRLGESSLIARRLASVRRAVVASPAYWDAHGRPTRPADLAGHQGLTYANVSDAEAWGFVRADMPGDTVGTAVRPSTRVRANNGDLLAELAAAGHGVAVLPTFLVSDWIEAGRLEAVLTEHAHPAFDAWVVYPPTRHLSRRVRAFIDFVADRFKDPPYWDRCLSAPPARPGQDV